MPRLVCNTGFQPPLSVYVGPAAFLVSDFSVETTPEGPQIIVTWGYPSGFATNVAAITLVRKVGSYPENPTDGLVLFSDGPPFARMHYSDIDVGAGTCYYYTMFSHRLIDGVILFSDATVGYAVPYTTGEWERRLYEQFLPDFYAQWDAQGTAQKVLVDQAAGPGLSQVRWGSRFNWKEPIDLKRGFLRRWYKIVGLLLDHVRERCTQLPEFLNLDTTPAEFLPLISELVGITPNYDVPIQRQREEIKRAVEIWKIKGRYDAIQAAVRAISGLLVVPVPWRNNLLTTNTVGSTSFSFDPQDIWKILMPNDPNSYVVSGTLGEHKAKTVALFVELQPDQGILSSVYEKLERVIQDYLRYPMDWVWFIQDQVEEVADLSGSVLEYADGELIDEVEEVADASMSGVDHLDQFEGDWMETAAPGDPIKPTNETLYKTALISEV